MLVTNLPARLRSFPQRAFWFHITSISETQLKSCECSCPDVLAGHWNWAGTRRIPAGQLVKSPPARNQMVTQNSTAIP
eukprot:577504-Amphidinium_carterae.1